MNKNNAKITKNMFDKNLRRYYLPLKIVSWIASKKWGFPLLNIPSFFNKGQDIKDVDCSEVYIPSQDGDYKIRTRIFKPKNYSGKLPGMLFCHGGGYAIGCPESSLEKLKNYLQRRPCIIVAPDYTKTFKAPYPAAFNDCYDTLLWMKNNADELGIDASRFIIAGHSAGGGLTAAVTLKAVRTKDVDIAFQMPIYPMLDDRQNTESARTMSRIPSWNAENNKLAWDMYLKDYDGDTIEYAAPARNKDYTGFPPTISYVGDMEPFIDETIAYIKALEQAKIPTKFEVYKGAFHAFEIFAGNSEIGENANQFEFDAYTEFYDKYILNK